MSHTNIEIKAKCKNPESIRKCLNENSARYEGTDHQIDTYFKVEKGRLKLREGNIENYLIYYERENQEGPKQSDISLFKTVPKSGLKEILLKALGALVVVDKKREIYWIGNVKFHIDKVMDLGSFVEIEAIDLKGDIGMAKLNEQCNHYMQMLGISNEGLISQSYSDLILQKIQKS